MIKLTIDTRDFQNRMRRHEASTRWKIIQMLQLVGAEVVGYLRSVTDERRPPARPGEGWRHAHPGGWATVTGITANSYGYRVINTSNGVALIIYNHAEHAATLEARDGFFVVRGVTEKDGPVYKQLGKAIEEVAPGWKLV